MSNHHLNWFKPADYQVSNRFKLSNWAEMISRRSEWEIILSWYHAVKGVQAEEHTQRWPDNLWDQASVEEDRKRFLDDYLADVLPCNFRAPRPKWYPTASLRLPAITDITDSFKELSDFEIEATSARVLMVDRRAPDTVLKQSFDKWLVEERKRTPLLLKRRGRPSANLKVTNDHLKSWRRYKVLAVLDLDFCAEMIFEIDPLTDEVLARDFLECSPNADPKEWGHTARDKAKQAKECLSLLEAQIQK